MGTVETCREASGKMKPDYINWSRGPWKCSFIHRLPEVVVGFESLVGHQGILQILTWWPATVTYSVILRDYYRSASTRIRDHSKSCSFAVSPVSALPRPAFLVNRFHVLALGMGPVLVLLTRARCRHAKKSHSASLSSAKEPRCFLTDNFSDRVLTTICNSAWMLPLVFSRFFFCKHSIYTS